MHPGYEFYFWNNSNIPRQFLKNETIAIIDNTKISSVSKSDSLRFDIVGEMGGVYLDSDMEPLKAIDEMFENDEFIGETPSGHIGAGIFGSIAGGEWVGDLSNTINKNILNNLDAACNMKIGPDIFKNMALCGTRSLRDKLCLCKKIYQAEVFYPDENTDIEKALTKHHRGSSAKNGWMNG